MKAESTVKTRQSPTPAACRMRFRRGFLVISAADAEDRTDKHVVTPGPLAPARELYGFMLLDRGMASEALAELEGTIKKEPNRFNAFAGAARASERVGDKAKAKDYYQKLAALANDADTVRPDLAAARRFLAEN